ncbi:hypothetical protein QYE76_005559 [Lolium multiflorum]|uniref:CCHC-type domain-containing protein n=1 Tax=Lolium multiflorum TaxID=4521 RepID=A0AAD8RUY6_LOLMU|nr:hypothetical protein QYE76_005559 [Lolium multiflorum]
MENYSLLMGAAAVMKMAVEMAAVSMEKPSGALPRSVGCQRLLSPDLGFAMAAALEGFPREINHIATGTAPSLDGELLPPHGSSSGDEDGGGDGSVSMEKPSGGTSPLQGAGDSCPPHLGFAMAAARKMAPPTRNNPRAQANQMHLEHAKMTDTIDILAMERKALRHQHAKKDYLIARLRVRIASLEQLIPIPNHAPRGKSTVTCYECGVTGHYSRKCPMKAANNAPRTGSNVVPITQKDKSTVTCYECGTVGHYSNECPKKLARTALNTAATAQQQRCATTGRKFAPHYPNNRNGRYYRLTATEAQEAPQTMPSMSSC